MRSRFSNPDEILKYSTNEEEHLAKAIEILSSRAHDQSLLLISKMGNRKLLEDLLNGYKSVNDVKFAIKLPTHDDPSSLTSTTEKMEIIKIADEGWETEKNALSRLLKVLEELNKKVKSEINILK